MIDAGGGMAAPRPRAQLIVLLHNPYRAPGGGGRAVARLGWRGLAAARAAGARVVLHLHNYRLVCANGVCFTHGEDCVRCQGRSTWPGVRLNCRGGSRAESAVYGVGLATWQRRLCAQVDAFVVPSAFALARLRE